MTTQNTPMRIPILYASFLDLLICRNTICIHYFLQPLNGISHRIWWLMNRLSLCWLTSEPFAAEQFWLYTIPPKCPLEMSKLAQLFFYCDISTIQTGNTMVFMLNIYLFFVLIITVRNFTKLFIICPSVCSCSHLHPYKQKKKKYTWNNHAYFSFFVTILSYIKNWERTSPWKHISVWKVYLIPL